MKKIVSIFISIIIGILLVALFISLNIKEMLVSTATKSVVGNEITSKVTDYLKDNYEVEINSNLKEKIQNSESLYEITEKYLNKLQDDVKDDKIGENLDIKEDITKILNENKDYIEKEFGYELSEEKIDKISESISTDKNIQKAYNNKINTLSESSKDIISLYDKIISKTFRIVIISLIVLLFIILLIINLSLYKWSIYMAISFIISGCLVFLFKGLFNAALEDLSAYYAENLISGQLEVNFNSLNNAGYLSFLIAFILICIYIIGNIVSKNTKNRLKN